MVVIILGVFFAFNLFIAVLSNSYDIILQQKREAEEAEKAEKLRWKKKQRERAIRRLKEKRKKQNRRNKMKVGIRKAQSIGYVQDPLKAHRAKENLRRMSTLGVMKMNLKVDRKAKRLTYQRNKMFE